MAGRTAGLVAIAFILCSIGGCDGRPESNGSWIAVHDTIGDTIAVRTIAGSVRTSPAALVQELSIGLVSGPPELTFGSIGALAVDTSGHIFVFDWQVPVLRKYGPGGRYLSTFARDGGGPGEYRQPDGGALAVLPDGSIVLRDPGNARINVYSPDGIPLTSWPIPGGHFVSRGLVVDSLGNVYTATAGATDGMATFSSTGEPGDTIAAPTWDYRAPTVSARDGGSSQTWTVPFSPAPRWAFSPLGRMFGGISDAYRIDVFGPEGKVLRITRDAERQAVAPGERVAAEFRVVTAMRGMEPDWRWNGAPIPDSKPAFRELFAGRDGRIWVLLHTAARPAPARGAAPSAGEPVAPVPWIEPVVFDVFEPDGTYLGQVDAPEGFRTSPPPVFGPDHVWAVIEDDLGVQSVARFRIGWGLRQEE